jgi:hypothetical protein
MNTTLVQLFLFAIFVGPICMVCPMLLIPTANFRVLYLSRIEQDFMLARSRQDWIIARSAQRFSSPLNPSPTPTYSPVLGVELQDAPCFVESHPPLEADPELLYRYSEEVLLGDTWFDFCQTVQPYLESDAQIQEPAKLPLHRQFSNAVQNLYLDVLAFLKVQSCRLAYLFYSQSSSTTQFESKSSSEPKQKAHTRMREPKQKITRSIVAHSQSILFWLFDCLVVGPGKDFPDSKIIRAIGTFLTWLWVFLIHGDLKVHVIDPHHDLTHLHLGLGTSVEDEILAQISEPILFGEEGFPKRLGSFQNRFIELFQTYNSHLDFVETFTLIGNTQPRIAQVHQRLSYILDRPIDHNPLSRMTTAYHKL